VGSPAQRDQTVYKGSQQRDQQAFYLEVVSRIDTNGGCKSEAELIESSATALTRLLGVSRSTIFYFCDRRYLI